MSTDKVKTDSSHLLRDGGGGQNKGNTSRQPLRKMEQMSGDLKGEAGAKTRVFSFISIKQRRPCAFSAAASISSCIYIRFDHNGHRVLFQNVVYFFVTDILLICERRVASEDLGTTRLDAVVCRRHSDKLPSGVKR